MLCSRLLFYLLLAVPAAHGRSMFHVLITGFKAFDHQSSNPSAEIAASLNNTCTSRGVCFQSLVLAVSSEGASAVAAVLSADNTSKWDAVLHLGEDVPAMFESVTKLHVETVAANVRSHSSISRQLDHNRESNDGDDVLIPGAPDFLPTTANLEGLWSPIATNNSTVMFHRNAGSFFCNEAFFRTLYAVRAGNITAASSAPSATSPLMAVIFIHVPPAKAVPLSKAVQIVQSLAEGIVQPHGKSRPDQSIAAGTKQGPFTVLLTGFQDRIGPDRSGSAVSKLNGSSIVASGMTASLSSIVLDDNDAGAEVVADALVGGGSWDIIVHVAEQGDRLQQGVAVQAVSYVHKEGAGNASFRGDEDDLVVPSTIDFGRLDLLRGVDRHGLPQPFQWVRDNQDEDNIPGSTYFQTLTAAVARAGKPGGAPAPRVLLVLLPFGSSSSGSDDVAIVQEAARMVALSLIR